MEIKVLESEKNFLRIELKGEGHTFCNVLVRTLLKDPDVEYAAYRIEHPLVGVPELIVRTNGNETPYDALKKAANGMRETFTAMKHEFEDALASV